MNRESEFEMPSQRRQTRCGNCRHHRRGDGRDGGWICLCDTSDYYLDETDYNHGCVEYEPRAERRF
jgi:hypothetical protein